MKIVKIPLYNTYLRYFVEPDFKKGARAIKKYTGREALPGGSNATFWSRPDNVGIIWFETKRPTASTIAHEVIHAAWFILDEAGVIVTRDNHEALTYLVGYIIKKLKI